MSRIAAVSSTQEHRNPTAALLDDLDLTVAACLLCGGVAGLCRHARSKAALICGPGRHAAIRATRATFRSQTTPFTVKVDRATGQPTFELAHCEACGTLLSFALSPEVR